MARRSEATSLPGAGRVLCRGAASCLGHPASAGATRVPPAAGGPGPHSWGSRLSRGEQRSSFEQRRPLRRGRPHTHWGRCSWFSRLILFRLVVWGLFASMCRRIPDRFCFKRISKNTARWAAPWSPIARRGASGSLTSVPWCRPCRRSDPSPPARGHPARFPAGSMDPGSVQHARHSARPSACPRALSASGPVGSPSL